MNETMSFTESDPEFEQIMQYFMKDEVAVRNTQLDVKIQQLISIVSLVTQQSTELLGRQVAEALSDGVTPVEIKEAVYHCAPYVGFPRAMDAIKVVNQMFVEHDISLPLEGQSTVNGETRFSAGVEAQATIFGEAMRRAAENGPDGMSRSGYFLASNCFGDYYTRNGLDLETRELLTLCILVNLGTESQIRSHITGNVNMGRDKACLTDAMYQCLPFSGYPRLLNALACLKEVVPEVPEAEGAAVQP